MSMLLQRCLSGLRSTIGNRVTANTRPEVQILFSAPLANNTNPRQSEFVFFFEQDYFGVYVKMKIASPKSPDKGENTIPSPPLAELPLLRGAINKAMPRQARHGKMRWTLISFAALNSFPLWKGEAMRAMIACPYCGKRKERRIFAPPRFLSRLSLDYAWM